MRAASGKKRIRAPKPIPLEAELATALAVAERWEKSFAAADAEVEILEHRIQAAVAMLLDFRQ
jgi:hypothetical protein